MRSNKWNINWQVARVKAKQIKDIQERVNFIQEWLSQFNHYHNIDRIRNWLRMSIMSANRDSKQIYQNALDKLFVSESCGQFEYKDMKDEMNEFSSDQLQMVLNDLEKRTYTFQYKGKCPPKHIAFVERLQDALR
jgi:hypothetical protein